LSAIDFLPLLSGLAVLLCSLTVHEAAHAWAADRLGDSTARMLGRLSLNPAVHIDPIGTVVFPLIAMVSGLPLIGWAKPVPVNVAELRGNWRQKFMVVAAAGPASNLVLAVLAATLLRMVTPESSGLGAAFEGQAEPSSLAPTLYLAIRLNVLLAVFNMMPIPPLDGGNVLSGLLSGPMADAFDRVRPYGFLILYGLMFTGALWTIISPPASYLLSWLL
jgi:Zn-dependent protease